MVKKANIDALIWLLYICMYTLILYLTIIFIMTFFMSAGNINKQILLNIKLFLV